MSQRYRLCADVFFQAPETVVAVRPCSGGCSGNVSGTDLKHSKASDVVRDDERKAGLSRETGRSWT
jgi:hypothetical protein